MMNKPGMLVVYSGPSGVGKGTILGPFLNDHPNAVLSVSVTTRQPRPGEIDGVHYSFITKDEFQHLIDTDGLLEYAQYSGNYYGTPKAAVDKMRAQGKDVFLEIEVQGAMKIKKSCPEAVLVFILPPTYESLKERLLCRGTETKEIMEARLNTAKFELAQAKEYDYIIINDDVGRDRKQLCAVVEAAKCETRYMLEYIEKLVNLTEK